jgi:hypothetical protein
LTPKMSELEVIDVIGSHYLNYVRHVLVSACVRTLQEALSFLNKQQIMDGAEVRHGSNCEPPSSGTEHSSSAGNKQSGHYRPRYQPQDVKYTH